MNFEGKKHNSTHNNIKHAVLTWSLFWASLWSRSNEDCMRKCAPPPLFPVAVTYELEVTSRYSEADALSGKRNQSPKTILAYGLAPFVLSVPSRQIHGDTLVAAWDWGWNVDSLAANVSRVFFLG